MARKLLMGIVPYAQANSVLDNLSEAEFEGVSVIMEDEKKARELADDTGPLKDTRVTSLAKKLETYKLSDTVVSSYLQSLTNGDTLIALQSEESSLASAKEILATAGGELLIML